MIERKNPAPVSTTQGNDQADQRIRPNLPDFRVQDLHRVEFGRCRAVFDLEVAS